MSVNIIKKAGFAKGIKPRDMKDGHAYMGNYNIIYIGNTVQMNDMTIKAFSVCGHYIALESDEDDLYIEIDLDIIVK